VTAAGAAACGAAGATVDGRLLTPVGGAPNPVGPTASCPPMGSRLRSGTGVFGSSAPSQADERSLCGADAMVGAIPIEPVGWSERSGDGPPA